MDVTRVSTLLGFVLSFAAASGHAQSVSGGKIPPGQSAAELALSASFAPPRYVIADPQKRERVLDFLRKRPRDSVNIAGVEGFRVRGDVLTLSSRLAERLAGEHGGDPRLSGRKRTRLRLEEIAGGEIEEDAIALPAEYYPNDVALQTTAQWALRNTGSLPGAVAGVDIGMTRVWEKLDGGDSLVVAVLDAGYNFAHPDLQGTWFVNAREANGVAGVDDDGNGYVDDVRGWDFVDADNEPRDYHGHGTQTGGAIAALADNGIGVAGMLPRVRILPIRVLGTAGFGNSNDIANGIRYAAAMKADVINFSIGISGTTTNTTLRNAFIVARDSGVIVAAASANEGLNLDSNSRQPGSYGFDNVYVVAAHTPAGGLPGFSNYGGATVDLAAPGADITTTTIPPAISLYQETFEAFDSTRWTMSNGVFQVAFDSLTGSKSLKWISGNGATAMPKDTLNLRGRNGGLLRFRLTYQPAGTTDRLYADVQFKGSTTWTEVGNVGSTVTNQTVSFNLGVVDDTLFRLRFQACVGTSCTGSTANRVIRIDDLEVLYADESPANQGKYVTTGGTSLASPYFAGYAALMRLATKRTGVPFTRSLMLAGVVTEPALAGKVKTGGRLDVAKGLDFYLRTLPRITVSDSNKTNWAGGLPVNYSLGVADSTGSQSGFTFAALTAPSGGTLSSSGQFAWNPGSTAPGEYILRAKASKGTTTLRTLLRFSVNAPVAVAPKPGAAPRLRVGGRAFALPASAAPGSAHALRLDLYGADGRLIRSAVGELVVPAGAARAEYRLDDVGGFAGAPGLRAWLDGVALRAAPEN